jgi:hypothetical protein
MKFRVTLLFVSVFPFACLGLFAQGKAGPEADEMPAAGIHWAKGAGPNKSQGSSSPNLIYHQGPIMPTADVTAIFWGPSWATSPGDKITGLDSFYQGIGGSSYAGTCNEYTDSSKAQVTSSIAYHGHLIDTSQPPSNGNRTSAILAEVCRMIPGSQLVSNGYYPVYIDRPRNSNYCAWHSDGNCNGVTVQFAFFYKLDGDAGCDPQSSVTSESQGLAALANVSGHELSEARNDPHGNAWFDSSGSENADKCAWTFGTPTLTLSNGTQWKIQGNWSNNAFNTGSGYPNSGGQKGCIDGGNYR